MGKSDKVMKYFKHHYIKIFFLTVGICLMGCISQAQTLGSLHLSSHTDQQKDVIIKKGIDLQEAIERLEDEFNVVFLYRTDTMKGKRVTKTLVLPNNIEKALKGLLKGKYLEFKYLNPKTYGIFAAERPTEKEKAFVNEQVTGTVTDAQSGKTLPGVNILVKGTTTGTSTDTDGNFELEVLSLQDTLAFTYIGYQRQEVPIGGQTEVNVTLQPQAIAGEELVVVGYGTQRKSDLTGSISSIQSEDFNPTGVNSSVDQLMQGKSAGVRISQSSSEPGGATNINIRGVTSVNAGNQPLYVIDGYSIDNSQLLSGSGAAAQLGGSAPRNPLNALNPHDIESIEILKDASATAIYGSRGANGVIIVTTKSGSQGETQVSYNADIGFQTVTNKIDLLSTEQYVNVINGISEDAGNGIVFSESDINQMGSGTDWQDKIFRTAPISSHNLSFSGGDEKTTYYSSFNYFDQKGVVRNTGIQKYIGRINVGRDIGEKASINLKVNRSVIDNNNSIDGRNINEFGGPIYTALGYDPTEIIFNEDGSFTRSSELTINNPVSLIEGISSENKTDRTMANVNFQYNFTDNIEGQLNLGYDQQQSRRDIYNSSLTIFGESVDGIANIATLERENILVEYTMNYNSQLTENSSIDAVTGVTYQDFASRSFSGSISGFASDNFETDNLGVGDTDNDDLNSNQEENSLISYLGRINYNLFDKFLLTASFRADGSSRFGENNKFGYFPSFAFAWRIAEEKFIPPVFNEMKLRISWGVTGNQEIGNYPSLSTYSTGTPVALDNELKIGIAPSRLPNPDLKWETTKQFNIGIDASILNGRISAILDYFVKDTEDMLIDFPLPTGTGYNSILSNIGSMGNTGVELQINTVNISKRNFSWNTSLNISRVRNEVTDLGELDEIIVDESIIREGTPLYSYYGYEITGIFQEDDNIAESPQPTSRPGYPIFRDVNSDNRISPEDRVVLGDPFPDFTYGIQNTLAYKNFQLNFLIQGQQGVEMINRNVVESMYPFNFRRNRIANQVLNRWTPENPDTKWPSGVQPTAYGGGEINTLTLQDASYISLKNAQLSYRIPVDRVGFLRSATLSITGKNIVMLTDYTGYNPEANSLGRSARRVDFNGYPLARIWQLGANITF